MRSRCSASVPSLAATSDRKTFPDVDLWLPLSSMCGLAEQRRIQRTGLQAFGRLATGVSGEQAQAEFRIIGKRLEHDYAETNANIGVR